MVSLMDIFTILVFFLLVNSSDVETLSSNDSIKLPESISESKPRETLVIAVNAEYILLQGKKVSDVNAVLNSKANVIEGLKQELLKLAKIGKLTSEQSAFVGEVTIMGDKQIPYKLLKKIMMTCAESDFGNISLAVQQRAKG